MGALGASPKWCHDDDDDHYHDAVDLQGISSQHAAGREGGGGRAAKSSK